MERASIKQLGLISNSEGTNSEKQKLHTSLEIILLKCSNQLVSCMTIVYKNGNQTKSMLAIIDFAYRIS